MEKVDIAAVADNNYAQHLGVMLCSLFENKKHEVMFNIHIVDGGLSESNISKLRILAKRYDACLDILGIEADIYRSFMISHHVSHAVYYRISLPDILAPSVDKVIYLDCDLVIKDDIIDLWSIDISKHFLAAVENPGFKRFRELGIPAESRYFNSGVMLIDLTKWRGFEISRKVLDFIARNPEKIIFWDQDALNAVLYDKWISMHPKWNVQTNMYNTTYEGTSYSPKELNEAIERPAIIHYTTSSKPWQYMNRHPLKNEYYRYLQKTDWRDYKPLDKNVVNILKKKIKLCLIKYIRN